LSSRGRRPGKEGVEAEAFSYGEPAGKRGHGGGRDRRPGPRCEMDVRALLQVCLRYILSHGSVRDARHA